MSMMNTGDILETIEMFTQDNLDVRTVTMGISLLDCIDPDPKKACENIYNKITTKAANLVVLWMCPTGITPTKRRKNGKTPLIYPIPAGTAFMIYTIWPPTRRWI